jgi:NAD(P)-dependent dehydrogenase (short-subunit alcohol dehydrogenase family)
VDSLRGRTAVVTGGGSGIGRGLVMALAAEGANVVVADIEADAAEAVATEAAGHGVAAVPIRTDVSNPDSVQSLADQSYAAFGVIDVLCNNAGVLLMSPVQELMVDDWQWVFSVNLMGVVHGIHAFLPRMLASGKGGHVVNTASVAAVSGGGPYSASKSAVLAISEGLHEEFASAGIGVTVLLPANISSRITSSQRNRPSQFGRKAPEPFAGTFDFGIDPIHVGQRAVAAIKANELYTFVFPAGWEERLRPSVEQRFARILAALDQGGVAGDP